MVRQPRYELKRLAREHLMGNYLSPMLATLFTVTFPGLVLSLFPHSAAGFSTENITYLLAAVIIGILSQLISIGLMRMHLQIARRQKTSVSELFWPFRNQPDRYILGVILLGGILLVPSIFPGTAYLYVSSLDKKSSSLLIYAAFILILIVFGAIALTLYYTYCFALVLMIDFPGYRIREAFEVSRKLMQGNKLRCFLLDLSFLSWLLLGILSLGFGMLWIQPYVQQTTVNFYLDLTNQLYREPSDTANSSHFEAAV